MNPTLRNDRADQAATSILIHETPLLDEHGIPKAEETVAFLNRIIGMLRVNSRPKAKPT